MLSSNMTTDKTLQHSYRTDDYLAVQSGRNQGSNFFHAKTGPHYSATGSLLKFYFKVFSIVFDHLPCSLTLRTRERIYLPHSLAGVGFL